MNPAAGANAAYRLLGHAAVWPALYGLGVYLLTSFCMGFAIPGRYTIAYLLLVGHACYLLDRVKLSDRRQDPADALALPARAMLFARHGRWIRPLVVAEAVAAALVAWALHPFLAAIAPAALLIVHLYAGRGATPGSPRFKDLPALKAFVVASGHVALVVAVLWANHRTLAGVAVWRAGSVLLSAWLIVSGDAILCDIDDEPADRAYHTRSLPVLIGSARAWLLAACFIAAGSLGLLALTRARAGAGVVAGLLITTTLLTRRNPNHRDFVDARLLPIVLLGLLAASA